MENKYCVIGGQYDDHWYGDTPTLEEAENLANKNMELWDFGEGWHRPYIYRIEDTVLEEITDNIKIRVIKPWANPIDW